MQSDENVMLGVPRPLVIAACLFLTFCSEVTNGFRNIEFSIYGNWIGFILLFFILLRNLPKAGFLCLIVISITAFYTILRPENMFAGLDAIKWTLYTFVAILLGAEFSKNDLSSTMEKMFFSYIILALILFSLGIGVDADFFSGRIQGLTSEPSALALIITYVFWQMYYKKKYGKLLLVLAAAILTFSLTVYACVLLHIIVRKLLQLRRLSDYVKGAIFLTGGAYCLLVVSELSFENPLAAKVVDAATHTISLGERGRNTRAIDTESFFDAQHQDGFSYWLGNGPSSSVVYYKTNDTLAVARNLPTTILFDFGVVGVAFLISIIFLCLKRIRQSSYFSLFVAALTYCMINGAAGFVNDIYLFSLISYSFMTNKENRLIVLHDLIRNSRVPSERGGR